MSGGASGKVKRRIFDRRDLEGIDATFSGWKLNYDGCPNLAAIVLGSD